MQYGIAVFPSQEVQDYANGWRIRYDPNYSKIPPFLTVRDREAWSDEQLSAALKHLETVTAGLSSFLIRFNRVSNFYPITPTLYLALDDPLPMKVLHEAVCSGPLAVQHSKFVYTPHVTIGQQMNADELHDLYGNLRMSAIKLTSTVDRIQLIEVPDDGNWSILRTFPFGG
ncbi:2'-5' RNA ligase family protein [Paenibacillus sp. NPDC058071]|uniref:2'-5' RNA ligase family protein n=1 Tax=Paenibacillus sp. NPDC058071 TaxID=3346326 RepID=UPI0036DEDDD1